MAGKERRSHIRENFSFKIRFGVLTREEYEKSSRHDQCAPPYPRRDLLTEPRNPPSRYPGDLQDSAMRELFLRIDEKLDLVLSLLCDKQVEGGLIEEATGRNISGSGMNMVSRKRVERGNIIRANFILSIYPLVIIDLFGEIVRVSPVEESGKIHYSHGVKFLDLDPNVREKVIACVFQRQRQALRKRKRIYLEKGRTGG
ncbi:MAG: PilZ domain-containing protein [Deltaproteobacteria bacterium]|nr:PilZ domain-containing protein [Deltaproteobacteria bacterium]